VNSHFVVSYACKNRWELQTRKEFSLGRAGQAESGLVKRESTGEPPPRRTIRLPLASLSDSRSDSHSLRCRIHASLAEFFSASLKACSQAISGNSHSPNEFRFLLSYSYCWFSHDVTKIQSTKLLILLIFTWMRYKNSWKLLLYEFFIRMGSWFCDRLRLNF